MPVAGPGTTGVAIIAVEWFLRGRRVLYAAPTTEQLNQFWKEVKTYLADLIDGGVFLKNETEHTIERPSTNQSIHAKTAWNADTLRGDYADLLILDEWQIMDETAWDDVGAPMLLDNNGDAIFVYTPPSLRSQAVSKAKDPRHASRKYKGLGGAASSGGRRQTLPVGSLSLPQPGQPAYLARGPEGNQSRHEQSILPAGDSGRGRGGHTRRAVDPDTHRKCESP